MHPKGIAEIYYWLLWDDLSSTGMCQFTLSFINDFHDICLAYIELSVTIHRKRYLRNKYKAFYTSLSFFLTSNHIKDIAIFHLIVPQKVLRG